MCRILDGISSIKLVLEQLLQASAAERRLAVYTYTRPGLEPPRRNIIALREDKSQIPIVYLVDVATACYGERFLSRKLRRL